jgi:hypothetical protein
LVEIERIAAIRVGPPARDYAAGLGLGNLIPAESYVSWITGAAFHKPKALPIERSPEPVFANLVGFHHLFFISDGRA